MKPVLVLLLLAGNLQAATIYQCVSPTGRAIFSDQPCGADAKLKQLSTPPVMHSDMGVSPERQQALDQDLAVQVHQRRLDRIDNAIAEVERQQDSAEREHDKALRELVLYQDDTSEAGRRRYRLNKLAIDKHYRDTKKQLQRRLVALQKDRREAERY